MASAPQHRCVFVGNIPYDATEEQLIQICEEVGPVVSFRLVTDRETGKPKGYGFCEYKDEETALSARRNLQGYEINGRQLRVDFAENDKGADRSRDQGRGAPGTSVNDAQRKQSTGQANAGDPNAQQPIGLPLAMTAASVMAGALGGPQNGGLSSQTSLQSPPVLGQDPLTLHLAKMSRRQLTQVISDMKLLATQNKEVVHQLCLLCPQLPKALFQAQIMLGMVTPQMLQKPNIRQVPTMNSESSMQAVQVGLPEAAASFAALPPLAPVSSSLLQNPILPSAQFPVHSVPHASMVTQPVAVQQTKPSPNSGGSVPISANLLLPDRTPAGPPLPVATSVGVSKPTSLQHSVPMAHGISGHHRQFAFPNVDPSSSLSSHQPQLSNPGFQTGRAAYPGNFERRAEIGLSSQVGDGNFVDRVQSNLNVPPVSYDRNGQIPRPAKRAKLEDGTSAPFSTAKAELPPGVESALLEQVMNLTPEQLSSLAPEQQQQVIQLQQMLR